MLASVDDVPGLHEMGCVARGPLDRGVLGGDSREREGLAVVVEVLEEEEGGGQKNGEKATKKGWW